MKFKKNKLYIENISADNIVTKFGSPTYCYSLKKLKENIKKFKNNFKKIKPLICFSVKSNSNDAILKEIKLAGLGADVVSMGELLKALKNGISARKIVFSGVGKSYEELRYAVEKKILLINCESESEILDIIKIAKTKRKVIDIGIRLNPDIDAKTINKISTGKRENKFGLTEEIFLKCINKFKNNKNLNIKCLSVHIGSQISSYKPYSKMLTVVNKVIKKSGHKFEYIDLGGGMGIKYNINSKTLNYKKYNNLIINFLKKNDSNIIFEPGRSIIGDVACLLTKVLHIKKTKKIKFIILDSAMNDFMRPALYNANHRIIPSKKNKIINNYNHEFVGPICETTDKFSNFSKFQKINKGDVFAILDVGAYGMVLSSNYNLRTKPAEVLVRGSSIKLITKRQMIKKII
tara:strand:- start:1206 stop:2420 length:1215 start_codon:yes stop_codon:yes gene_type:complete